MNATSKRKWYASLILAGILLLLAMVGGKWGTTYAADAGVNAAPYITSINPFEVPAGSPYKIMIIMGGNFGDISNTRVRLTGTGVDKMLAPIQILPDGISVVIDAIYLVEPKIYEISVVKSNKPSIPSIPIWPIYDEVSNSLPFNVYVLQPKYIPVLYK